MCESAPGLILGGDDIVEDVQVRGQVDSERKKVEMRENEEGNKARRTNAQTQHHG